MRYFIAVLPQSVLVLGDAPGDLILTGRLVLLLEDLLEI